MTHPLAAVLYAFPGAPPGMDARRNGPNSI
jgi:hypothetical protein